MKYEIFEGNMERLEKKLTRIANKCRKFGCDFTYEIIGETFHECKDERGTTYTTRFIEIETTGTAIMNDWQFIASVEHTEKGNIIKRVCDIEVPERYYNAEPYCEHCQSRRYRKNTYIVRNTETGEFKQVGRSCLADFTHGLSAEAAAHYIACFDSLIEGEAPYAGCSITPYIEIDTALKFIAETIRHFGYAKTQESPRSTASRALEYYNVSHGGYISYGRDELEAEMTEVNFNADSEESAALAENALAWILSQEESNNYMHNLKTACSLPYVTYKNFGLLASLFPSYDREMAYKARKEAEVAQRSSDYVGKVTNRITIAVDNIRCVTSWETEFGMTYIYKILGADGNIYVWKTGKCLDDDIKTITGTVKAHTEYRDEKQTEVTRCRVA